MGQYQGRNTPQVGGILSNTLFVILLLAMLSRFIAIPILLALFIFVGIPYIIVKNYQKNYRDSQEEHQEQDQDIHSPNSDISCNTYHKSEDKYAVDIMGEERKAYNYATRINHSLIISAPPLVKGSNKRKSACTECGTPLFLGDRECPLCGRRC